MAQFASSIPLAEDVSSTTPLVSWGPLVNLYIMHGKRCIEHSGYYGEEEEIRAVIGSVIPSGRWEHAWERSDEIVTIPPDAKEEYHVVALRGESVDGDAGAVRLRLHDLSEVAKSKDEHHLRQPGAGDPLEEWEREELRFDGRDGKPCLLLHLPR